MGIRDKRLAVVVTVALAFMAIAACQPDSRSPNWSLDAGDETGQTGEPIPGEWTHLPSLRGGGTNIELGGTVFGYREKADGNFALTKATTDGSNWRPVAETRIGPELGQTGHPTFAETGAHQYVSLPSSEGPKILRAPSSSGAFQEVDLGVEAYAVHSLGRRLMVKTPDTLKVRSPENGDWRDIDPPQGQDDHFWTVGSVLILDGFGTTPVTTDFGQTWARTEVTDPSSLEVHNPATKDGDFFSIERPDRTDEEETNWLLSSQDGVDWEATELTWQSPDERGELTLEPNTLVAFNGELFALDIRTRLLRIDTEQAKAELMVDSDFSANLGFSGLQVAESALVTPVEQNGSAVLTWSPGDSNWSLAPVARGHVDSFVAFDDQLWSIHGVLQSLNPEEPGWEMATAPRSIELRATESALVGLRKDCVYLRRADGWENQLHWGEEPKLGCNGSQAAGRISDVVSYRDGFAIGKTYTLAGTPGHENGSSTEVGNGGLVYWNPSEGEIENLVPERHASSDRPFVSRLVSQGDTLWAITEEGEGLPGDDSSLYRIDPEGEWTGIAPAVIGRDGKRRENDVTMIDGMGHDDSLLAFVAYPTTNASDPYAAMFGRWSDTRQAFVPLPKPPADVEERALTRRGPVALTSDAAWNYALESDSWRPFEPPLPFEGSDLDHVVAHRGALYMSTKTGTIWQLD